MGTQRWHIDPESFGRAANKTQHVADRISAVWSKLDTGAAALGTPWGTCRTGEQFSEGEGGNGYLHTKENVGKGLVGDKGMVTNVESLAEGQRKTGDKVREELEEDNRRRFRPES
ncbi:hypothetical protein [Nocardia blacklockiae]|uniref:hypothetical protein n=1 Tax=Nocardia blacklockiae TaxID=480036 RepID=UPI001895C222|nr:hypothetical protein [Nocardia blacklockiae]MBF6171412.1 hypothetical protein [Nocardia blacklockiae]